MNEGKHVISEGKRFRECVEIKVVSGKKESRTFHQELIKGKWVDKNNERN